MAQERVRISSDWGSVTAELADNDAARALRGPDHFVIYYRNGRVPQPGIVILGEVTGDVSIFDRPGSITVRIDPVNR
jgi:hypothetical protein